MESNRPHEGADQGGHVGNAREALHHIRASRQELARDRAVEALSRHGRSQRTTFYIASSPENHVAVRTLADFFESRGWRWSAGHAWNRQRVHEAAWVARDMHAALTADVFILLLGGNSLVGAHAQLGGRWAVRRSIYGIRHGSSHHPLHDLPEIIWHETMEDYVQATFGY